MDCNCGLLVCSVVLAFFVVVHTQKLEDGSQHAPNTASEQSDLLRQHLCFNKTQAVNYTWTTPGKGTLEDCPAWIKDYVSWHKKTRGTPGAKYLVNACLTKKSCTHGLGDRLRGLLATFQLAQSFKRVMIITWPSPHPIEAFLEPTAINWTLCSDLKIDLTKATVLYSTTHKTLANLTHVNAGPGADKARVWRIDTNTYPYKDPEPGGERSFTMVSFAAHCIFQLLFKPTAALTQATDEQQLQLLGNLDKPFVAMHLRLGHLVGENMDVAATRGWELFQGVMASYRCAIERDALLHGDQGFLEQHALSAFHAESDPSIQLQLASIKNTSRPDRPRIILLTDHKELRGMVSMGMIHGMAGPSSASHHYSYSATLRNNKVDHRNATMSIFVDLMLLVRARCMVWSMSGFNKFAMAYAWTPCTVDLDQCLHNMFPETTKPPTKAPSKTETKTKG